MVEQRSDKDVFNPEKLGKRRKVLKGAVRFHSISWENSLLTGQNLLKNKSKCYIDSFNINQWSLQKLRVGSSGLASLTSHHCLFVVSGAHNRKRIVSTHAPISGLEAHSLALYITNHCSWFQYPKATKAVLEYINILHPTFEWVQAHQIFAATYQIWLFDLMVQLSLRTQSVIQGGIFVHSRVEMGSQQLHFSCKSG